MVSSLVPRPLSLEESGRRDYSYMHVVSCKSSMHNM